MLRGGVSEMTNEQKIIRNNVGLVKLAEYGGPQNQDKFSTTFKVDFAPLILVGESHGSFLI